jgi:hypothetical protein
LGLGRETRREKDPVARGFVGVRKRNQEGEGTCCTGFRWKRGGEREKGPVALGFSLVAI